MESTHEMTTSTTHGADAEATAVRTAVVTLPVNADDLCTSQQKRIDFMRRRVFPNPKVLRGMRCVQALARPHTPRILAIAPLGSPVAVDATFLVPYPKGTPKSRRLNNSPMPEKWDLDNKWKAVGDALTIAGWWLDDRYITSLHLRKRRVASAVGSILIEVSKDTSS